MDRLNIDDFRENFKDKSVFETSDIVDYYCLTEKKLKRETANWRIYSLVQKGVLQRVGRGKFRFGQSANFIPEISPKLKSIYSKIVKNFPYSPVCVWCTSSFNEFMRHQLGRYYYLIEVEKDAAEAVFFSLKEKNLSVFFNPKQEILDKYIPENRDIYIVKALISEAPTQKVDEICTVSMEKMLVDVFCDKTLFATQQGAEMRTIFNEALGKYTVNQNKMLRYADRRKKRTELIIYLDSISNYRQYLKIVTNY